MLSPRSSQVINLRLTPMQIAEALPVSAGSQVDQPRPVSEIAAPLSLVLRPEEPSEMMVQIRNLSSQPLQLTLQLEGDFPQSWCQIGTEGTDVQPGQETEAVLYFQLAADFFEHPQALGPGETLKLNYRGSLSVHTIEPLTGSRQVETATFELYVRPHSLYPRFLPAVYREIDFVGRFLKIFEQAFEPAVQTCDALSAHLDPLTAPVSLLPFLAHWVGWSSFPGLRLDQQRHLIRNALEIYRWRGTRRGLRFYLHLATGLPLDDHLPESQKHIRFSESFSQGFVMGAVEMGHDATLGGGRPFYFKVQLYAEDAHSIDQTLVHSIIEQEKPAFCTYDLEIIQSRVIRAQQQPSTG